MGSTLRMLSIMALLGLAAVAPAYPNFNAATGIVGVPNGLTQLGGTFVGAADLVFLDEPALIARAVFGLLHNLEVGAVLNLDGGGAIGVSAKYRIPVTPAAGAWAVGLSCASTDEGSGLRAFAVVSRAFTGSRSGTDLLGSLGVLTDFGRAGGPRPFVGAQLMLPNDFEIGAEFQLESGDADALLSLVARRQFSHLLGAEIGITNARGFSSGSDYGFFLGIIIALPPPV